MAKSNPRVCIIGAGIAGLTSAKYLKEEGITFTVLESTRYIGGTWRYDPRVGKDENGLRLHTSMYKHLRTNLPKPTMELRGFPMPKDMPSFPSWEIFYKYIKSYAAHFDLERHIKFLHMVTSVVREGNVWKVKHQHVLNSTEYEEAYDFVIVGTGHHSKPNMPDIPTQPLFRGTIIHSHDYRVPEVFNNRRVLIVGAGPSGMDIAIDVAYHSKRVIHSHHSKVNFRTKFPDLYVRKPDIKEFNETGVFFVDGTYEEIDDVIYCTGYEYDYPFLDDSCGLTIHKRSVIPLYKYMVNINQPTMVIMGLIIRACLVVAIDAQARYATALIKGNFTLPSREEMIDEWQKRADTIRSRGRPISDIHFLAEKEDQYYEEMTKESGIGRVPPVMFKIRTVDTEAKLENLYTYRNYVYETKSSPRVCIIGAGIAGLTSAKYLKDEGIHFTILESKRYIGGTWIYDPRIGKDGNSSPLLTRISNLSKPAMEQREYPMPREMPSFPSWETYDNYIKSFVTHYDLQRRIKFLHKVTSVERDGDVWIVKHHHVLKDQEYEDEFDFVIVGTGHQTKPRTPQFPKESLFRGTITHRHNYRVPAAFDDRRVLVVGAGPSGMDVAIEVAYHSKTLVHSHHSKVNYRVKFPDHYIRKPDVKEFNETGVFFADGTYEEIDDVIYCTGYDYDYPFLYESCGLTITKRSVIPLYKYMVNINLPSMVILGLFISSCPVVVIDAQARYATALIKGNFTLPSRDEMMDEWQKRADTIRSRGRPISDMHFLAEKEDQYYKELCKESGIYRVSPLDSLCTYRDYSYEVIDNNTLTRSIENNKQ